MPIIWTKQRQTPTYFILILKSLVSFFFIFVGKLLYKINVYFKMKKKTASAIGKK